MVDAAVATSLALSVVRPASCGMGGGGFMVIWNASTKSAVAIDYRERAPAAATREMFLHVAPSDANADEPSRVGHRAVAVPGTVAGLCYAQKEYGRLELKAVLAPAIRLARDGFAIDAHDVEVQAATLKMFAAHPARRERFGLLRRSYLNNDQRWEPGAQFHSPQLRALLAIAEQGQEAFTRGEIAAAIVAEMQRGNGLITAADLAATKPVVRKPLVGRFDEATIIAMPPPSSGGVALLESLNIITQWERLHPQQRLAGDSFDGAPAQQILAETLKFAFADRARHLGDPDFVQVPVDRLIDPEYAAAIAKRIDPGKTHPPSYYGQLASNDDGGTSHFSIIDADGNAVACTETINLAFGSLVVEPKFGIILNNQMDDFAAEPGKPNAFGLVQGESNAVAAGKKPLSSMCPTIVVRDGKAVYAVGASGGPRIISSTLQVLLRMMRQSCLPDAAVALPRIHHQWLPDVLEIDAERMPVLRDAMQRRGHTVKLLESSSAVQAVSRTDAGPPRMGGGSDPRKHGQPAGY